jgi:hypothetical protein
VQAGQIRPGRFIFRLNRQSIIQTGFAVARGVPGSTACLEKAEDKMRRIRKVAVRITAVRMISQTIAERAPIDIVAGLDSRPVSIVVKLTLRLQTLADLLLIGLCRSEGDGIALSPQCSSLGKGERAFAGHPLRLSAPAAPAYRHVAGSLIEAIRGP